MIKNGCYDNRFRVIFHQPNEVPTTYHKHFFLNFGDLLRFDVTIKSQRMDENLRFLSPKMRKCYFEGERNLIFFKSYSKVHCDLECFANFTVSKCGCAPFDVPRNESTLVCGLNKFECLSESKNSFADKEIQACGCFSACNDVKYFVEGLVFKQSASVKDGLS
jgi:amiloride-sensitive sodium channel